MNEDKHEFLSDLRAHIAKHYVTQRMAAVVWGVSKQYLNDVVRGVKPPNQKILKAVGYTRQKVEVFEKLDD